MSGTVFGRGKAFVVDTTPPTVQTATIDATGMIYTLVFSENVTGSTGHTITPSGGAATVTYASGSGTSTILFSVSRAIQLGENVTRTYASGNFIDGSSNALANFTAQSVQNDSNQTGGSPELLDGFEGTNPTGWDAAWTVQNEGDGGTHETTTAEFYSGAQSYQQHWVTNRPPWLKLPFSPDLANGEIIEIEYDLKYHSLYDYNNNYNKCIIMQCGSDQELYIDATDNGGNTFAVFQNIAGQGDLYPNQFGTDRWSQANNLGAWHHFRWRIKTAQQGGTQNGYLQGWIDGVKWWDHTGLFTNTVAEGLFDSLKLDSTQNVPYVTGPNQKRWFDNFSFSRGLS